VLRLNTPKKGQNGYSLIELIVVIVLLGVMAPAIISIYGDVSVLSATSAIMDQMLVLAEEKMEEISGKKENDWDWYKNPTQYEVDEALANGYHRTVTVTTITNWGAVNIDGWEVYVLITHPQYTNGFSLTTRFAKYYEEK